MNNNIGFGQGRGGLQEEDQNSDNGETGNTNFNNDIYQQQMKNNLPANSENQFSPNPISKYHSSFDQERGNF